MNFACERDHRTLPPAVAFVALTAALLACWLVVCAREPAFAPPTLVEAMPRLGATAETPRREPSTARPAAKPVDPVLSALEQPMDVPASDTLFRAAQVLDRCDAVARSGALRLSEQPGIATAQERALERRLDWCDRSLDYLAPSHDGDPNQLRLEALREGSLLAEAHGLDILAARHGVSYAEDLARELLATRDPEFIVAVARYIADRSAGYGPSLPGLDLPLMGREQRTLVFEIAAQSLACGFGQDCGLQGALMQDYCIELGVCYGSFDQAAERELLSPRDFERMLGLRAALHASIASGDFAAFDL